MTRNRGSSELVIMRTMLLRCALVGAILVTRSFAAVVIDDINNATNTNEFLDQCRRDCAIHRNFMECGRYRAVRWINDIVHTKEYAMGPFKIIKIPSIQTERFLPEVSRSSTQQQPGRGSGVAETMYFVREAAEELLTKRALVYTVEQPTGARAFTGGLMILDDDELNNARRARTFEVNQGSFRIFKKKKNIILPVLILLNLLKLKLLILPIFLGVHFIKKLLVLGSLLLPSILSHLKICKIASHPYPYHPWAASAEYPVDYPTAYGHEDSWDHRNDVAGAGAYSNYYSPGLYNPFAYYLQNYYSKQQQQQR